MSLKVKKLGVQVADIIDFGTASGVTKLIAGGGISVAPVTGVGTVTVTNAGVTSLIAGTGVTLAPASGIGNVTVSVSNITDTITPTTVDASGQLAGVNVKSSASDHKHQLANPITGTVVIAPTSDVVPLSITTFPGVSDALDITTGGGLAFALNASGGLTLAPFTDVVPLTISQANIVGPGFDLLQVINSAASVIFKIAANGLVSMGAPGLGSNFTVNITPRATGSPTGIFDINANNITLASAFVFFRVTNNVNAGVGVGNVFGLDFSPSVTLTANLGGFRGIRVQAQVAGAFTVGVTGIELIVKASGAVSKASTARGLWIETPGTGFAATGITTGIGVDIEAWQNTVTGIGIRQLGTSDTNRFAGNIVIGSTTVAPTQPLQLLKAATNALISGGVSGEANFRVQIQHDQLQFGPGGAVALDTFLQRTAANQLDINAVLRPSPDNTYDIGTITAGTVRWRHGFYSGSLRASFSGNAASYIQLRHDGTVANIETALAAGGDTTLVMATEILEIAGSGSLGLHQLWLGGSSLVGIIRTAALNLQLNTNSIVHPDTDNLRDFGDNATPLRWRGGFFTGQVTARNKPVIVVENFDETQASATVPNVDTNLKTYALPANSYTKVVTEGEGYIVTTVASTQQDLNIKIKYGAAQVGNTVVFNPETVATGGKIPFTVKATALQAGAVTIAVTIGAAAADLNTSVFLNSLRIYGEA